MKTGPRQRVAGNIERTAEATEQLNSQMSVLLGISLRQLAVQQQLYLQDQIHSLTQQQLAVIREQLVQAAKTGQRLGIANQRLAGIDASLADISGLLVQQNALVQESLHRLATGRTGTYGGRVGGTDECRCRGCFGSEGHEGA
jgi:hypothetical protein